MKEAFEKAGIKTKDFQNKTMIKKGEKVRFAMDKKYKKNLTGEVIERSRKYLYIQIDRVAGKFAKSCQKNVVCVYFKNAERI